MRKRIENRIRKHLSGREFAPLALEVARRTRAQGCNAQPLSAILHEVATDRSLAGEELMADFLRAAADEEIWTAALNVEGSGDHRLVPALIRVLEGDANAERRRGAARASGGSETLGIMR